MRLKLTLRRLSDRWWGPNATVISVAALGLIIPMAPVTTLAADVRAADLPTHRVPETPNQAAAATPTSQAEESIDSWMPNKALQQVVLNDLKDDNSEQADRWQTPADITKADMKLLKVLFDTKTAYVDGQHEYSLEGLQYATNLQRLSICGGINAPVHVNADVVDVTPLKNLQSLKEVDLQHNRIKDVSPLAGLKNVTSMALAMNYISDFSQLPTQQYTTFTYTGQFIELPPAKVNQATRTAHLKVTCKFKEDRPVELLAPKGIGRLADWNDAGPQYAMYFNGGEGTPDGQGGLTYAKIVDQAPGPTTLPNQNIFPLPDKFYLVGQDKEKTFNVVQPYQLATAAQPVTAKYQDETGKPLHDDVVFNGLSGEDYHTEQLKIAGYTFKRVEGSPTGKFGKTAQTVTYVYAKDPQDAQPVTVQYVADSGEKVAETVVLRGKVGEAYVAQRLKVAKYVWAETKGAPEKGTFGTTAQTVTQVYSRIEGDSGVGDGSGHPDTGNGGTTSNTGSGDSNLNGDNGGTADNSGQNTGSPTTPGQGAGLGAPNGTDNGGLNDGLSQQGPNPGAGNGPVGHPAATGTLPQHQAEGNSQAPTPGAAADELVGTTPGTAGPLHSALPTSVFNRPDASATGLTGKPEAAVMFSDQGPAVTEGKLPQTGDTRSWGRLVGLMLLGALGAGWLWRRKLR